MVLLAAVYIAVIFLLPLGLSAWVGFRSLPWGRRCPQCGGETLLLRAREMRVASVLLPRTRLQRRWCPPCEWTGTIRCLPPRPAPLRVPASPAPAAPVTQGAEVEGLDLRSVHLDGTSWRVRLEFWERTGRCFGRLVFVGPDGRRRTDAVHPFSGRSRGEVVGQALALSEGSLTHRLRHLATE